MIELLLAAENALALGLIDQAEKTFRQVLEADPRNGIAAVGLSRVALERGDEAGALALARAALEIDPENATARRTIERLEEVARYRAAGAATAAAGPRVATPQVVELKTPGGPGAVADPESMIRATEPVRAAEEPAPPVAAAATTIAPAGPSVAPALEPAPAAEPSAAPTVELAPAGQPGLAAEPSATPAPPVDPGPAAEPMPQPGEPTPAAERMSPADAPMTQPGPPPAIPMPAPARPGLLRRLLRRS